MNGPDAEYAIAVGAGSSLQVSITGFTGVVAYALAACTPAPQTPTCEGGSAASPGTSITVTPTAAGTQYVMVDSSLATGSGSYTLTVTIP